MEGPEERSGDGGFRRPWEDPDTAERNAVPPRQGGEGGDPHPEGRDEPDAGEERAPDEQVEDDPSALDLFSHDAYVAATTSEYQGLAEEVARAQGEEYERQAVAASLPGVGSGLIGFEDVTGQRGMTEEEAEVEEQRRASDLTLRVVTAAVLLGLFLGSLVLGGAWFSGFVTIVMILSLGELYATARTRGYAPPAIFGFVALIGIGVGTHRTGAAALSGWLVAAVVAIAFFYAVAARRNPLENASITIFGLAWVSLLSFAIVIARSERAVGMILLIVLLTAVFDVGSYFVGRAFGRRALAPRVSPQKTIEGLLGGVVGTFALSAVLSTIPLFDPLDLRGSLGLALMVSVLAPLGDAGESVVKRALDVKDMGSLLPGHGGMLDRIDALLFVVPVASFLLDGLGYL